jgi:hypothetical protein
MSQNDKPNDRTRMWRFRTIVKRYVNPITSPALLPAQLGEREDQRHPDARPCPARKRPNGALGWQRASRVP